MSDDTEDDDKVGYRHPPKRTQFKKGQSGNPAGRPKSRKSGQTDVSELLNEPIKVKAGGKVRTMQSFEAGFRKLAKKAIDGDMPAIAKFLRLCEEYDAVATPPADTGCRVIHAPRGVDFQEWLDRVTELLPADED